MTRIVARHVTAAVASGRWTLELLRVRLNLRSITSGTSRQSASETKNIPRGDSIKLSLRQEEVEEKGNNRLASAAATLLPVL